MFLSFLWGCGRLPSWGCKSNGLKNRALIVHREIPCYIKGEGRFNAFEIFTDEHITIPKRTTDVK